ncbi:MAG TPA: LysR family transcriptional regulator [Terriglobia bacterium]|nr:LysR family transcriptional regulator [Terriglobia bacterium]
MNLQRLEMLKAVVESGSYSRAGQQLNISHSAIHRQIKILEEEIHERALRRNGRRMELTEAGRVLVELASRLQREISSATRQINEFNQMVSGHLRIGTGSTILVSFLPSVLQRFREKFPGVEIYVVTTTSDDVIEEVEKGKLDIGVVINPADVPRGKYRVECEILYREEFLWAIGRKHPLANKKFVSLLDMVKYPFIMTPKRSHIRRLFERTFEKARLHPRITVELENEEAIEKLAAINIGVALLPTHRPPNEGIHYFRLPRSPIICEIGLVLPRRDYLARAVREFVRICHETRPLPGALQ